MHPSYEDITSRIAEQPAWYDRNGVPRYGAFDPSECSTIYADSVALFEIACQACGRRFLVERHRALWDTCPNVADPRLWHYGDPPRHGCVGDSMNCEDLRVIEFWTRQGAAGFVRNSEFEGQMIDWLESGADENVASA